MGIPMTAQAVEALYWFYAFTSLTRLLAYVPQVLLLTRSSEAAASASMLTWASSTVSHFAAATYAVLVVADFSVAAIAAGYMIGSAAVVRVAVRHTPASRTRSADLACRLRASTGRRAPLAGGR